MFFSLACIVHTYKMLSFTVVVRSFHSSVLGRLLFMRRSFVFIIHHGVPHYIDVERVQELCFVLIFFFVAKLQEKQKEHIPQLCVCVWFINGITTRWISFAWMTARRRRRERERVVGKSINIRISIDFQNADNDVIRNQKSVSPHSIPTNTVS